MKQPTPPRSLAAALALTLLLAPSAASGAPPDDDDAPLEAPDPLEVPALTPPLEPDPDDVDAPYVVPGVVIRYTPGALFRVGGSVGVVDEEVLEEAGYDNPDAVLQQVPGVTVRGEDGYGLRPNIGLRGVSSERSQKVTLMEDGVLFGPAPYSAPAAYYFPLMQRMVGVEVSKGPAAILYGPQTIGGAVNLLTRDIPTALEGGLDLGLGSAAAFGDNVYFRGHGHVGTSWSWGGFLAEVAHVETDGFKVLDRAAAHGQDNTGFSRTDVMLKARAHTDLDAEDFHRFDLKLGFGRELSHETYLGLSDADFEASPYRRYAASALDRMDWERFSAQLAHSWLSGDDFDLTTTLYRHDMTRAWRKLNRFRNGPSLEEILADPDGGVRRVFYDVLTGAEDTSSAGEALMIGTNDRSFVVMGAQTVGRYRFVTGEVRHEVELGLRYHYDRIEREHTEDGYEMQGGVLVRDATPREATTRNLGESHAVATHLRYAVAAHGLTATPGVRVEWIANSLTDRVAGSEVDATQAIALPGVGLHYAVLPSLGVLAGVTRGFSPVGPGQPDEVLPETSVNYEAGVRFLDEDLGARAEAIFFYNDYSNITGQCTLSSGCDPDALDSQFNGGEADVFGLELAAAHRFDAGAGVTVPVRLAYTFTDARFGSSFESANPQFGQVTSGDLIPYVPAHQASLHAGVAMERWSALAALTVVGRAREVAGPDLDASGPDGDKEFTDTQVLLDLMAEVQLHEHVTATLRVENVLDQRVIASRRPYGARPIRPFGAQLGVRLTL